jgi:anti-anti-sigma factor
VDAKDDAADNRDVGPGGADADLDAEVGAGFAVDTPAPGRVAVVGVLDAATAPVLDAALLRAAAALDGSPELVLDCAGLDFIDSSGLSVLVANHQRLCDEGKLLVVASPPPAARRLFEIAGLDEVLIIR